MTKFLFINAINPSCEMETSFPHLGIGYLISSLREKFKDNAFEFKVIDTDIQDEIVKFKPDIVGISSVTQNYNKAIGYAKIAKEYKLPVVIGGVHISMLPSTLTRDMDVGVIGEGEKTICDLADTFLKNKCFDSEELKNISGLVYWNKEGGFCLTEKRKLIKNIDEIPLPTRDLLKIESNTHMFTSRGCPFRCSFCASSRFWDRVRFFSAEYVVNEIKQLVNEYKVKSINFFDDLFILDRKRIKNIIKLLEKENILGKVVFGCEARSNMIDDELIQLLKKMNVKYIAMGLESGCQKTLDYLKGTNITIGDNLNAIKTIKKYGLEANASFIIGSPMETKENIMETLRFIKKSKLDSFGVFVLTPFPGTPIWNYAKSRGLVNEKMNWDKLDVNFVNNYGSAIILSEKLTRQEIIELFFKFERLSKFKKIKYLINLGLKNPQKIPGFFIKKARNFIKIL